MTQVNVELWLNLYQKAINISPIIKIEENWGADLSVYFYRINKQIDNRIFAISCFKDFANQVWADNINLNEEIALYFNQNPNIEELAIENEEAIKYQIEIASMQRLNFYFEHTNSFNIHNFYNVKKYYQSNNFYFIVFEDNVCYYAILRRLD